VCVPRCECEHVRGGPQDIGAEERINMCTHGAIDDVCGQRGNEAVRGKAEC
jgi:hypothetical protein